MKSIFKYPLALMTTQRIMLPRDANILTVQLQDGTICLWAEVIPENPPVSCSIKLVGTGIAEVEPNDSYIGTVQQGPFVWHVYRSLR
jgi:hypothetical protein